MSSIAHSLKRWIYLYRLYNDGYTSVIVDLLHPPNERKDNVGKVFDRTDEGKTKGTIALGGITNRPEGTITWQDIIRSVQIDGY